VKYCLLFASCLSSRSYGEQCFLRHLPRQLLLHPVMEAHRIDTALERLANPPINVGTRSSNPGLKKSAHGPEHLQVSTLAGRVGSILRRISHTLESPHASFATRIACAVLCSQIPAYLRQTQAWYNAYRGVWASITIATCTTRTIGQSAFGIAVRMSGLQRAKSLSMFAAYADLIVYSVKCWELCVRASGA